MAVESPQTLSQTGTSAKSAEAAKSAAGDGLVKQVNFILRPNAIVAEGGARVIFVCG